MDYVRMLAGRPTIGWCLILAVVPAVAQVPLGGSRGIVRMINTDMAVLEAGEPRKDLPCAVTPIKPVLGFDLRFHGGYEVSVPLKELAGSENLLTVIFRVTPVNRKSDQYYFVQKIRVPSIEETAKGDATLGGTFDLGEGNYKVDWLMRDRAERVCSSYWDVEAALPARDRQIDLMVAPGDVQASEPEAFTDEPPVERRLTEAPLNIKVLINFAPQNALAPTMRPVDVSALVSILRQISREPQIVKFSLVAFNVQEQRVLYRQKSGDKIDFPALGEAFHSLKLGTVAAKNLEKKNSEGEFLTGLIRTEMAAEDHPDALIFAGPKIMLEEGVQLDALKEYADVEYPVFYMNYNLNPQSVPWRDAIGRAVKFFKGTEYTITRPRDLWQAVSEMVQRIVKSKHGRNTSSAAFQ